MIREVPITVLSLVVALLLPDSDWMRPIILANSLVGFAYTAIEREAIQETGFRILSQFVRISSNANPLVNVAFHVLLPILVLRRGVRLRDADVVRALAFYAAGRVFVDVDSVYPRSVHSIETYTNVHFFVFLVSMFVCYYYG